MAKLSELLSSPGLETANVVTGSLPAREVSDVAMVDDPARLHKVPEGAVVILTPSLLAQAQAYHLDIWGRTVAERGAALLLLHGYHPEKVPRSATRLASRSEMALACVPAETDAARLVRAIGRVIDAGSEDALARATAAARALAEAVEDDLTTAELCALAAQAAGCPVQARRPQDGEVGAPVLIDGVEVDHVAVPDAAGPGGDLARIVARLTAETAARVTIARRRAEELPIRSRSQLLSELLTAGPQHVIELVPRARSLGLGIDDWHAVVQLDVDTEELSEAQRFGFGETLGTVVMQAVGRSGAGHGEGGGAGWHLAYADGTPLLVRTWGRNPGEGAMRKVRAAVETVHAELARRMPERRVRFGIGSVHETVEGLRASWAEARAALLSDDPAHGARTPEIVVFDDLGLHRMLVEWYTTHTARTAVRDLLAPLERLGPDKCAMMVRTLRVYLDQQGSLSGTATALNLHRNAVSYRLKRIVSLLDVDLDDPDQRLALHLACRAWKLS
ncbi:PucR family transcriptional regulator [Marinactinospora thermotolerans]|uniref:PucR C-terminal helix-turn-helix domain-containing protein n=1 Tax=Marinactinospora thermotolerans DSM 45154 TaxID=1122192 RepID=A0A1T4M9B4_9ACTN|nr:helix-turn-helix domain-containing protein [Marinactinospora thermotolerans]SJZ63511.1 PucR C-terminal helix-turn-helix domain-containing protein [Marinactinospora thermotolerans DSM 45154]